MNATMKSALAGAVLGFVAGGLAAWAMWADVLARLP